MQLLIVATIVAFLQLNGYVCSSTVVADSTPTEGPVVSQENLRVTNVTRGDVRVED